MKVGVLHTQNEELKKLMSPMTYYSPVISVVQEMIRKILSDVGNGTLMIHSLPNQTDVSVV